MQATTLPIHEMQVLEEERLMTYQVTFCCNEGVVIASDRCEFWIDAVTKSRSTNKVIKLFTDPTNQVAWTFSGGFLSGITAQLLLKNFPTDISEYSLRNEIEQCGNQACADFRNQPSQTDILVAVIGPSRKILRARISPHTVIESIESGKLISGQTDSLVNFFPEHFFTEEMPLRELASLAAYCVRMAHDLDPKYVDGLDIAIYRDEEKRFEFVDRNYYWEHAMDLDKAIRECLDSHAVEIPPSSSLK